MFEFINFVLNVDKIPMEGERNKHGAVIQSDKPDANCFKCVYVYCNDKKQGRYDSNGVPDGGCCGYHEVAK